MTKEAVLGPTLPQGSVGPCAVLWCPLVGVLGAVSVPTLLFLWGIKCCFVIMPSRATDEVFC